MPRGARCPFLAAAGSVLVLVLCGCGGGPATVTGVVKYKGQPLTKGQISFIAADGKSASGVIGADGTYSAANVPAGAVTATVQSYRVEGEAKLGFAIQKTPPKMDSAIPKKYNDPSTSGLKYTIDSRSKTIDIDLTD